MSIINNVPKRYRDDTAPCHINNIIVRHRTESGVILWLSMLIMDFFVDGTS